MTQRREDTPVFKSFQRAIKLVGQLRLERGDWIAWMFYRDNRVFAGEVTRLPTQYSPNVWVKLPDGSAQQVQPQNITSVRGRPVWEGKQR